MKVAICDDNLEVRQQIRTMCEAYFAGDNGEYQIILFESGEEVMEYVEEKNNTVIDILFLDIEMPGINGIALKDILTKNDKVWRIVYVSNYMEKMIDTFSTKTIGFLPKPVSYKGIEKMLKITTKELAENIVISVRDIHSNSIHIKIEDIVFFKAEGSYTQIFTKQIIMEGETAFLTSKTMGDLERETMGSRLIRVHKSYMINPDYLKAFGNTVELYNYPEKIPIGRTYREVAKRRAFKYGKSRIQGRL